MPEDDTRVGLPRIRPSALRHNDSTAGTSSLRVVIGGILKRLIHIQPCSSDALPPVHRRPFVSIPDQIKGERFVTEQPNNVTCQSLPVTSICSNAIVCAASSLLKSVAMEFLDNQCADGDLAGSRVRERPTPKPKKKTLLVTGSTGFIGAHVTRELLDEGYCVYTIVRK